jgi:hypothetical protein
MVSKSQAKAVIKIAFHLTNIQNTLIIDRALTLVKMWWEEKEAHQTWEAGGPRLQRSLISTPWNILIQAWAHTKIDLYQLDSLNTGNVGAGYLKSSKIPQNIMICFAENDFGGLQINLPDGDSVVENELI